MSYNPSIPNPTDFLSDSQGQIKTNFTAINAGLSINHYPLSPNTTDTGKHKFVEMVNNAAPVGAANEGVIYTKTIGAPAASEMFYKPDATTDEYQVTRTFSAGIPLFGTNTNYPQVPARPNQFGGWTFLPGGLLLQYGRVDSPTAGPFTVKFPISFTSPPYIIELTPRNDGSHSAFTYYIDGAPTSTSFNYQGSTSGSNALFWMAIGI